MSEILGFFSYLSKDNATDSMFQINLFLPFPGLTNIVTMNIGFLHELQIASEVSIAFVSSADTVGSPSKCKLCSCYFYFFKFWGERIFGMNTCTPSSLEANFSIDL